MKALKRYGQNFLVDRNILGLMLRRSEAGEDDCILEIGPGHGVLTRALLEAGVKCVHAVEVDERLKPELEELSRNDNRLVLHWGDAVKHDYASLVPFPNKVIANIPYNITTPLIWELLKYARLGLTYHLYMLQKEAADRLTAPPDTKARYPLGVCVEAMGRANIVRNIPPECFRPIPEVNSALTEIVLKRNFELAGDSAWSELLHRGFAQRRKTLANNLRGYADAGELGRKRAEDLTSDEWIKIYSSVRR
ncbi:MAG: ribosomal RNA small subunit methyltransferase A [Synergistaceae bacterium]|nr:ribosomal RNA small subunit methyltransferase A [Synergistaceae bacterium]